IANHIRTELKDNVLKIYFENRGWNWKSWTNTKMKAYVTVANLKRLEVSGACNVRTTGVLKGNDLMMEMSGASDFLGEVSLQNL
ncbi:GIN domain-containing protein, partial [Vibrio parahaemolyticus]